MNRPAFAVLLLLSSSAVAQGPSLPLPEAVNKALAQGVEMTNAKATWQKAQTNFRAVRADPTSLIDALTQAEQEAKLQDATLQATRLSVMQQVIGQYVATIGAEQRLNLAFLQLSLEERQLKIAQAKLSAKVATPLDVNKAQAALNQSRQDWANAKAQVPVLKAQLARLLGLGSSDLKLPDLPRPPKASFNLAALQGGLETRLSALLQAAQAVQSAELRVRLSNNEWTPARTLQDAQSALANAQRSQQDAQKSSLTNLRDALRTLEDANERVGLAQQNALNAQTSLKQAQARLSAGTAAAIEVQQAQVQMQQAQNGVDQAQGEVWKALASLSVASGLDLTGLAKEGKS